MIKKISLVFASILLSVTSLFVLVPQKAQAAASGQTCTWDGSASSSWSNADNWSCSSGGPGSPAVPGTGDNLIFPFGTGVTRKQITNDLSSGTSFYNITFDGVPASGESGYTVSGQKIVIEAGLTADDFVDLNLPVEFSQDQTINVTGYLAFDGVVSGTGDITKTGEGTLSISGTNTFTGNLVINGGDVTANNTSAFGTSAGSTTINAGTYIWFILNTSSAQTISEPFVINSTVSSGAIQFNDSCAYNTACTDMNLTLSGSISLGVNALFYLDNPGNVTVTGALSGSHTLTLETSSVGKLIINSSNNTSNSPNATLGQTVRTITYSADSQYTGFNVAKNTTALLTGTYYNATVFSGGILKGTGTLKATLLINNGGILAPGTSPGCLSSGSLFLNGEFQVELQGTTACTLYDQQKVTGGVTLNSTTSTLNMSLINKYTPKVGDAFKIIDNDAADVVTGTFKGLPEGATFKVSGYVMKISYKGGDGNDVVVTVQSIPSVPETGLLFVKNNPILTLIVTASSAAALYVISKRMKPAKR